MDSPKKIFAVLKRGIGQHIRRKSAMSTVSRFQPTFDPYTYTQGRWLDRDKERRQARRLRFDFDALLDLAVKCSPGAQRVVDCEKKEGGFNRVFMIRLDNGKNVVARLPTRIAGPPGLTVSSEVATLQFVKEKTKVPVPSVLSWSSETGNAIGAEYMIMDSMPGVPLKDVWNTMTASQHIRCIQSIGYLSQELCTLSFPSYGSLYLSTHSPQGAVSLDDTFSIGPLCAPHHWGYGISRTLNAKAPTGGQGPWHSLEAYFLGLVAQAKSSMPAEDRDPGKRLTHSVEAHTELLDITQETLKLVTGTDIVKDAAGPTLFHPDFHTRNIFVNSEDPTIITGIIDWQSAAIEPAFVFAADTPDFAEELPYDETLNGNRNTETDKQSPQAKLQADVEFCVNAWAVMLQICPKYRDASALDPSLVYFLAAGSAGWLNDAVSTRSILTDLGEKWEELGLPGQSLYQPNGEEAEELRHQLDEVQSTRRLREHLSRLLRCDIDGWVSMDRWEEVLPRYLEEHRVFIASCVEGRCKDEDKAMATAKANDLWPFDQR